MSDFLLHFAVPFAAFSYFRRPKEAFLLSLVALLPDVDVVLGVHRSWTHSAVVLLALSGATLLLIKALKPELLHLGLLAALALLSHLVLDIFTTHTPILWPLIPQSLFLSFDGRVIIGEGVQAYALIRVHAKPASFTRFDHLDAPICTSESFAVACILVGSALLSRHLGALRSAFRKAGVGAKGP